MNVFVVNFENDVALEGIPFLKQRLPFIEITGLLARNIYPSVYKSFSELPIFEKKIDLNQLLYLKSDCEISLELISFLVPFEEQIHYHINRYYDTSLSFDYSLIRYKLILYVLNMYQDTPTTEAVYFGVTPHDPVSYLVYLVAKFRKLKVIIIDRAHWLNGYVLYEEIGNRAPFVLSVPNKTNQETISKDVNIIQNSLRQLMDDDPSYMKAQRKQFGSFVKKVWTSVFLNKRLTFHGYFRYREKQKEKDIYAQFVKVKNVIDLNAQSDKLIFFPLHYQPELTTSPDGGIYSQQWLAIKHLVEKLPAGFKVLVKEHPSQFLINSKRVRSHNFYKGILSISDKIEFVGLNVDSKRILDHASGVITITGTIGLESLLKGKPVLYFGDAIFAGVLGAFDASKIEDFINHIMNGKSFSKEEVLTDFNRFAQSIFFSGIAPNSSHPASHFEATRVLFNAYQGLT